MWRWRILRRFESGDPSYVKEVAIGCVLGWWVHGVLFCKSESKKSEAAGSGSVEVHSSERKAGDSSCVVEIGNGRLERGWTGIESKCVFVSERAGVSVEVYSVVVEVSISSWGVCSANCRQPGRTM